MNDVFSRLKTLLVPAALAVLGALQSPDLRPILEMAPAWVPPLVSFLAAIAYGGERATRR
jgi:hypothetical protein